MGHISSFHFKIAYDGGPFITCFRHMMMSLITVMLFATLWCSAFCLLVITAISRKQKRISRFQILDSHELALIISAGKNGDFWDQNISNIYIASKWFCCVALPNHSVTISFYNLEQFAEFAFIFFSVAKRPEALAQYCAGCAVIWRDSTVTLRVFSNAEGYLH